MKKRAFVRYSKQGKVVPGSLVLTSGSYPQGSSTWNEVPADLCCTPPPVTIATKVAADLSAASPLKLKFYCGSAIELLSNTGWTLGAGWTGNNTTGFTHSGGTAALTNTLAAVNGVNYLITVTITAITNGSITVAFGNSSTASISATTTIAFTSTNTNTLTITPTNPFDGTVVVSILKMPAIVETLESVQATATTLANLTTALNNTYGVLGTFTSLAPNDLALIMSDAQKQLICPGNEPILMTVTP